MDHVNPSPDDRISALADGVLSGSARAQAVQCVLASTEGMQTWHAYHVIGDVLRSEELAPRADDQAFWDRLSQKIAQEPDRPVPVDDSREVQGGGASYPPIVSANEPAWRWKVLAGLACAAVGGVLGYGMSDSASTSAQMAASGSVPSVIEVVDGRHGPMLRDPQLDSLMAAHQQVSGHSVLQVPAGFLRNATYEGAAR